MTHYRNRHSNKRLIFFIKPLPENLYTGWVYVDKSKPPTQCLFQWRNTKLSKQYIELLKRWWWWWWRRRRRQWCPYCTGMSQW